MYPHERSLVNKYKDEPFALIGVNSDKDPQALKKVLKAEKITWRSFWDGGSTHGPIAQHWGVHGWPTLYLIDRQGVIRDMSVGYRPMDDLIARLVREAKTELAKKRPQPTSDRDSAGDDEEKARPAARVRATPVTDKEGDEHQASQKLRFARDLVEAGKLDKARQRFHEIITKYPASAAARQAQQELEKLTK